MKMIVGLGNPELKHENNRHNVGYMVVKRMIKDLNISSTPEKQFNSFIFRHEESDLIFILPLTFMNQSGKAVGKAVGHYGVDMADLWVIHDDLDITLGEYKIQKRKGPKDHKGIISIEKELGQKDFWRVRVGVENRSPDNRILGEEYVLEDFKKDEMEILKSVVSKVSRELIDKI